MDTLTHVYHGVQVDTFYRDEDEVKVFVRAPYDERDNLAKLYDLQLASGLRVGQIADLTLDHDESDIHRVNGARTITLTADLDENSGANAAAIRKHLAASFMPELEAKYPDVRWRFSGENKNGKEAVDSLLRAYIPALLVLYLILATMFKSYLQPLIIMLAIPFSIVGALLGHLALGMTFSLLSGYGAIALTGIAVNDSLVLIDTINRLIRKENMPLNDALVAAGKRRLRPILLTSVTTICGMTPILLDTSFQAQFLKPMVVSITAGLASSTLLILLLVPAAYAVLVKDEGGRRKAEF